MSETVVVLVSLSAEIQGREKHCSVTLLLSTQRSSYVTHVQASFVQPGFRWAKTKREVTSRDEVIARDMWQDGEREVEAKNKRKSELFEGIGSGSQLRPGAQTLLSSKNQQSRAWAGFSPGDRSFCNYHRAGEKKFARVGSKVCWN